MSHFTTVATKITSLGALYKALDKLGLKHRTDEAGVQVRGWRGQTTTAVAAIDMGKYDVGVVQAADGTYTLVADWWGVETTQGSTEKDLVDNINREYAYVRVIEACEAQGYQIAREDIQVGEDGTVKLVASKWE
jgi:hypothetical protein